MATPPQRVTVNLSAAGDKPHAAVKRQIGKLNFGLYCTACSEFFAVAVSKPKDDWKAAFVDFRSDGVPLFECPLCRHPQRRQVSEIALLRLTERNRRKPPPPKSAH